MSHIRWEKSHKGCTNVKYIVDECRIHGGKMSHIGWTNVAYSQRYKRYKKYRRYNFILRK